MVVELILAILGALAILFVVMFLIPAAVLIELGKRKERKDGSEQ